jgi:multiple sugar transport system permease protein
MSAFWQSFSKSSRLAQHRRQLHVMMLPYLIGTLLLVVLPALLSLYLAFTKYDALAPPQWVGLANFDHLFNHSRMFWLAVRGTLLYILMAVPLRILGALCLALLLNQRRRGTNLYRAAVFLPTIIPDVAYALIWLWIFNPVHGPLNKVLALVGIKGPAWLVDGGWALPALALMAIFQIGEGFVVLMAGLQNIPDDYYQAAAVDGASKWHMFRRITLPLIQPWLVVLTIRDIILSTQNSFTPTFVMTKGGPYYATMNMPYLIFEEAFDRFNFGIGSALMVILFLGVGVMLLVLYRVVRGWGYADNV